MKIKTIISALAALLTVLYLSLNIAAVTPTIITLGSEECYAGETITLPLVITQNNGFVNARISVNYDEDVFTLTKAAQDKGIISGAFHSDKLKSPYNLSWESGSTAQNNYSEGIVAELTFEVSSSAKNGKYEIEVIVMEDGMIAADGSVVDVQCINSNIYIVQNPDKCSHSWDDWTSSSLTKHKHSCNLCGETESERHDWDDGEVTKKPTVTSDGIMIYTCDVCSGTKTETIPALEPDEYDITGTVTSYGTASEVVTVTLYDSDGTRIDSDTTTDGTYTLSAPDGTYILEVGKLNHVTREYEVTIDGDAVTQDMKICLVGDVTGDGKVNNKDSNRIKKHINETEALTGYEFKCADVIADGKVNNKDSNRIKKHINETEFLW